MCCCYVTAKEYLESGITLLDRIDKIDLMIDAMLLNGLDAVSDSDPTVQEYQMNDGQMIVRTRYKNSDDLAKGILSLEQIKQRYINQLEGRVMYARPMRKRC